MATALPMTSWPYAEPNSSLNAPSLTAALATPDTATNAIHQAARTEKRAIAAGNRLLPCQAIQPRAARPPTHRETPAKCKRRLTVARSWEPDEAACPVKETGARPVSYTHLRAHETDSY